MRVLKTQPILGLANSYLLDSPQPDNIYYIWNSVHFHYYGFFY